MMHQCSLPSDIHTAKCCIYILHVHNILRTAACQIYLCFMPFLFAVWQEIVFHARLTCEQQTNTFSQIKGLWHNNTNRQKKSDVN